ncbi:hypothetical protein [Alkaliphilus hydrothermalis]|uniref:Sporulation protein YjcZ n=1 Tax=Alkaliphilus hydrothermalis TaxID=1482730 RepID=A0ABS2NSY9_9FIRM|nr:hypothetical protein [Alkaliphilus hydrothermalis]MBM7616075.1 hypothetical protein [Alkaliphilus hydrothermalis]
MSEVAKKNNDFLSQFFGGIGCGKDNTFLICIVVVLCLFGGGFKGGCGGKGGFDKLFDENLILILVLLLILFGGTGSFKF